MNKEEKIYNIVDLFCGMGGGSLGINRLKRNNTLLAIDFWQPAVDTFNYNLENVCKQIDLTKLTKEELLSLTKNQKVDILIGSPPCQGFSMVNRHSKESETNNKEAKNHLFLDYLRVVDTLRPQITVMENVVGMLSARNDNDELIIDNIVQAYNSIGYYVKYKRVPIYKLGLPQLRERVIFLGARELKVFDNLKFPNTLRDNFVSLANAIQDIPYDIEQKDYTLPLSKCNDYIKSLRNGNDFLTEHVTNYQNPTTIERFKHIKPGCCMKDLDPNNPYKTKAKFNNSYKRTLKEERVPTLVNVCKNMFLHPIENRIFSVRETMRLYNFDDSFKFPKETTAQDKYQMLANSIPPLLTENIFRELYKTLDNYDKLKEDFRLF